MKQCILFAVVLLCSVSALAQKTDVSGAWQATFNDSVFSGTVTFNLDVTSEGKVTGVYTTTQGGVGRISGALNGATMDYTLTQALENCPGTFVGTLAFADNAGTGKYVGQDCQGEHKNGVITVRRPESKADAPAPPAQANEAPTQGAATQPTGVAAGKSFKVTVVSSESVRQETGYSSETATARCINGNCSGTSTGFRTRIPVRFLYIVMDGKHIMLKAKQKFMSSYGKTLPPGEYDAEWKNSHTITIHYTENNKAQSADYEMAGVW